MTGAGPAGLDWNSTAGEARFVIAGRAAATLQRAFGEAKNAEAPLSVANQANRSSIVSAALRGSSEEPTRLRTGADDCERFGNRKSCTLCTQSVQNRVINSYG